MKVKLKNGKTISIAPLSKRIKVTQLLEYINSFYNENIFLILNHKFSYSEEKKWLLDSLEEIKRKERIHYVCLHHKKIVASVEARKDKMRESCNVCLGIAITKEFRSAGLGTILLTHIIKEAKNKFKPKNIYLSVISENCPARKLYEKLGFRKFATFPNWVKYKNKYLDKIYMVLPGKK